MNGLDTYRMALAVLQLPTEWQVDVEIQPRRRNVTIAVKPGSTSGSRAASWIRHRSTPTESSGVDPVPPNGESGRPP